MTLRARITSLRTTRRFRSSVKGLLRRNAIRARLGVECLEVRSMMDGSGGPDLDSITSDFNNALDAAQAAYTLTVSSASAQQAADDQAAQVAHDNAQATADGTDATNDQAAQDAFLALQASTDDTESSDDQAAQDSHDAALVLQQQQFRSVSDNIEA